MKDGQVFNPFKLFVGSFIPNALMKYEGLSASAKLCWARLAQYSGKDGQCYPSQETLSVEIGIKIAQVNRVLKELEVKRFIKRLKPTGKDRLCHKTTRYLFIWHPVLDDNSDTIINDNSDTIINDNSIVRESLVRESLVNKTFSHNSNELRLSELLLSLILKRNTNYKKPNLQVWAKDIDIMIRLDNRDPIEIEKVILWCQEDTFWQNNILSTKKLRFQFDQLVFKSKESKQWVKYL